MRTFLLSNSLLSRLCEDEQFNGVVLFGDDECWADGEYYQYGICNGKAYKFYFDIPEELEDLGDIDYSIAYNYDNITAAYIG